MRLQQSLADKHTYAVILAGGVGSRFWPFSRELEPKQFITIVGRESLLQNTLRRLSGLVNAKRIYIITNKIYFYELKKQIEKFKIPESNILLEPEGKNTAPAIGLSARLIEKCDEDATLIVLPADHYIKDIARFKMTLRQAIECARDDFLVTLGIKPVKPSTGYGYISISQRSTVNDPHLGYYRVEKFLEKPSINNAKRYSADKRYFWNSGMFVWKVSVFMDELKRYLPDLYSQLSLVHSQDDIAKIWPNIKPISVDYGIMEHSKRIALIPADFIWSDLGSWDSLQELLPKDKKGNLIQADSVDCDSEGICVFTKSNRLIATIGLKDLIIADTPDALLVCDKHKTQDVKNIVEHLKSRNRKEHLVHLTDKRPWGWFTILQASRGFKIKLVEIEPKKRLSLQSHKKRAEHWIVVSGRAKVTRGTTVRFIQSNQSIYIPKGVKHRLENPDKVPLKIVEVQTGSYLEEDDIQRFDDDFNLRG